MRVDTVDNKLLSLLRGVIIDRVYKLTLLTKLMVVTVEVSLLTELTRWQNNYCHCWVVTIECWCCWQSWCFWL